MKKTIIAALLCAPLAIASTVTELNSEIKADLLDTGYKAGDNYELVLSVPETNPGTGSLLQLADGAYLVTQIGQYAGINTVGSNGGALNWQQAPVVTTEDDITTTTITFSSATGNAKWITFDKNGTGTNAKAMAGSTITLSYDGADTTLTIAFAGTNAGLVNKVVWSGVSFDANDFVFGAANAGTSIASFTSTPAVPEPATATLSLLALVGLAARRRRH